MFYFAAITAYGQESMLHREIQQAKKSNRTEDEVYRWRYYRHQAHGGGVRKLRYLHQTPLEKFPTAFIFFAMAGAQQQVS